MIKKNKYKKAQLKILQELKSQLILKTNNLGKRDYFTPLKLAEMALQACRNIISELLIEKANLEYELHALGTDKRDALIKIERLNAYIHKAQRRKRHHVKTIKKLLSQKIGNPDLLTAAVASITNKPSVSVMIGTH